jgi:type I restriction enzyme S subunit
MSKDSKKPAIRFKGFTDDWEQRKCGDVMKESRIPGHSGDVAKKITVKLWGKGVFKKDDIGSSNTQYFVRKEGQFIYSKLDFLNSAFGVIPKELDSYETTADLPAFDCVCVNPYFMFYRAIQPNFYYENGIIADGSRKAKRIHADVFLNMPLKLPSIEEQNKITKFLLQLENLITLHQRKLDKLKNIKKALLEKMFPRNGENIPEVRFKGFSDDWEQRKFSELYAKVTEKNDLSFGADKIISVANMYFKEDTKESSDDYMKTYNVMRLGDIAFEGNRNKNYAHGRFVENTIGDGIVSHVFDVFRPIVDYDLNYWKYYINNEIVMGRTMARCTKSSTMMTNLVANDFLKEAVLVPVLEEQKKIGQYFSNLDNLITLHQREPIFQKY